MKDPVTFHFQTLVYLTKAYYSASSPSGCSSTSSEVMPDAESPPVSSDGNNEEEPISSELAGEGENMFIAVGDNILARSRTLISLTGKSPNMRLHSP